MGHGDADVGTCPPARVLDRFLVPTPTPVTQQRALQKRCSEDRKRGTGDTKGNTRIFSGQSPVLPKLEALGDKTDDSS